VAADGRSTLSLDRTDKDGAVSIRQLEIGVAAGKRSFFARVWLGGARLWQAFWLVGYVGFLIAVALSAAVRAFLHHFSLSGWIVLGIPGAFFSACFIYSLIGIWRCAPNTDQPYLSVAARVWVFLWPLLFIAGVVGAI
jgi:hypothetical protein